MKYRNLHRNDDGTYSIVWFGSYGKGDLKQNDSQQSIIKIPKVFGAYNYYNPVYIELSNFAINKNPAYREITIQSYEAIGTASYIRVLLCGLKSNGTIVNLSSMVTLSVGAVITFDYTDEQYEKYYIKAFMYNPSNNGAENIVISYWLALYDSLMEDKNNHNSYSERQEGIKNSLIQRLSVIKNELWYNINYGLPLLDKIKNKAILDSVIINIINNHEEVKTIRKYKSFIVDHTYSFEVIIDTIYNTSFSFSLSYEY